MTAFTLASWNINSVRLRAPMVAEWVRQADPDVLCLQEIKCLAEQFPEEAFREMGFRHFHVRGQKGMHGVAIASKLPLQDLPDEDLCPKAEARHQRVMVEGIELHNFYIPAGGDEPDPAINPRFAHKLAFLERIEAYFAGRAAENPPLVLVGDFNIAPYENDVWSHKQLLKVISHTPVETEALERIRQTCDFADVARELIPMDEKIYSWWSYRARDWRKANRGRRLDHIWAAPAVRERALAGGRDAFRIWEDTRSWEKPSDHAPVVLEIGG
ncbi:exodeoxyribonuclease III [Maricaulis alexandrii]|uniref:exodeoxyribonuclease III n=1 Tax=Maricaulis alexandrii TaxID=2570354 RepID=UPI001108C3A6|nr:exodeoxyribonuclease III [Maricaulis alexandrii]